MYGAFILGFISALTVVFVIIPSLFIWYQIKFNWEEDEDDIYGIMPVATTLTIFIFITGLRDIVRFTNTEIENRFDSMSSQERELQEIKELYVNGDISKRELEERLEVELWNTNEESEEELEEQTINSEIEEQFEIELQY